MQVDALRARNNDIGLAAGGEAYIANRAVRRLLERLHPAHFGRHLVDEALRSHARERGQEERDATARDGVNGGDVATDGLLPQRPLHEVAAVDGLGGAVAHRSVLCTCLTQNRAGSCRA